MYVVFVSDQMLTTPLIERRGAQRDDEEGQAGPADQHAVDSTADQRANRERQHDREQRRHPDAVEELGEDQARERKHCADR